MYKTVAVFENCEVLEPVQREIHVIRTNREKVFDVPYKEIEQDDEQDNKQDDFYEKVTVAIAIITLMFGMLACWFLRV